MTIWDYLTKEMLPDNIRKYDDGLTTLFVPNPKHKIGGTKLSMWDMELPGTKTFCNETAVVKLSDDVIDRMKKSQIRLPKGGLKKKDLPDSKRPYYMIRGKSIGQDQVKMIIKEEHPLFRNRQCSESPFGRLDPDTIGEFLPQKFGDYGEWLWDTGEIGGNMISGNKYPEYYEFMPGWIKLAMKYPFLDMVIAYTNYSDLPCFLCPVGSYYEDILMLDRCKREGDEELARELLIDAKECKAVIDGTWDDGTWNDSDHDWSWWQFPCRRELIGECSDHFKLHDYRWYWGKDNKQDFDEEYFWIVDVPQMYKDVVLTLQIKDGNIDVITGEEAKQVFKDYNERYHFADPRRYSVLADMVFEKARIGEKMLKECMEECGMDFDKTMQTLLVEERDIMLEWL
ncbi:MAG: hypothetical protein K5889_02430 [Lachnospiraceae bacterium]|nr:hypothetical protein [Lachnospiraceae bacterium]